jgi:hypothetical protein
MWSARCGPFSSSPDAGAHCQLLRNASARILFRTSPYSAASSMRLVTDTRPLLAPARAPACPRLRSRSGHAPRTTSLRAGGARTGPRARNAQHEQPALRPIWIRFHARVAITTNAPDATRCWLSTCGLRNCFAAHARACFVCVTRASVRRTTALRTANTAKIAANCSDDPRFTARPVRVLRSVSSHPCSAKSVPHDSHRGGTGDEKSSTGSWFDGDDSVCGRQQVLELRQRH